MIVFLLSCELNAGDATLEAENTTASVKVHVQGFCAGRVDLAFDERLEAISYQVRGVENVIKLLASRQVRTNVSLFEVDGSEHPERRTKQEEMFDRENKLQILVIDECLRVNMLLERLSVGKARPQEVLCQVVLVPDDSLCRVFVLLALSIANLLHILLKDVLHFLISLSKMEVLPLLAR